jgi:hypothetical protein
MHTTGTSRRRDFRLKITIYHPVSFANLRCRAISNNDLNVSDDRRPKLVSRGEPSRISPGPSSKSAISTTRFERPLLLRIDEAHFSLRRCCCLRRRQLAYPKFYKQLIQWPVTCSTSTRDMTPGRSTTGRKEKN